MTKEIDDPTAESNSQSTSIPHLGNSVDISRRRSLQIAGSASFALSGIPAVSGAETDRVKVKKRTYRGEWEYMKVPAAWKEHLERALAAKEELSDAILDKDEVVSTSLTSTENPRDFGDGLNGFDIKVRVTDRAVLEAVPNSVDSIAVRYKKANKPEPACQATGCQDIPNELCHNIIQERPVPGGVALYNDADNDGEGKCGTLGAIVDHVTDGEMGLTANHVSDDPSGSSTWHQYCDIIGNSGTWEGLYDYRLIDLNSSTSGTNEIREPGGTNYEVTGYYSKSSVCAFADANASMRKTGAKSGTTHGRITDCGADGAFPSGDSVICECDTGDGDSGGVAYRVHRDGTATVISLVNSLNGKAPTIQDCHGNTTISTEMTGMSAYEIVNQENGDISFHF